MTFRSSKKYCYAGCIVCYFGRWRKTYLKFEKKSRCFCMESNKFTSFKALIAITSYIAASIDIVQSCKLSYLFLSMNFCHYCHLRDKNDTVFISCILLRIQINMFAKTIKVSIITYSLSKWMKSSTQVFSRTKMIIFVDLSYIDGELIT